jgi:hypothetical protein
MLTHAELTNLEQALRHRTVLSIYINGEVSDNAARTQWRTELRNALDSIGTSLAEATHAEREDFAATRKLAESTVSGFTPGNDAPGWMGLFTPDEVHFAGTVGVPVPTVVTWSLGANVAPAVRVLKEARPVLVVVADATRARIYRYVDRSITLAESTDRDAKVDQPYYMSRPAPQGFSSGVRGEPGTDAAQRELRKATDQMLKEVSGRISALSGDDAWILIGGIDVVAAALHGSLEKRLADRSAVVPIDVHDTEPTLAGIAREHASRLRVAEDLRQVENVLSAHAAGGTGAVGLKDIDQALLNGQVNELFVTSSFLKDHPEEAVSAIRRAFDVSASVEHVSGDAAEKLDAAGGIAAKLRFTLAPAG